MKYKILTLFLLSFFGVNVFSQYKEDVSTIDNSKLLVNGITISKTIVDSIQIQTRKKFELLKFYHWKDSFIDTNSYGHYDSTWHGIIIHKVFDSTAYDIFEEYYGIVKKESNYIYLTNLHIDSFKKSYFDIAIIKAKSQFDAVEIVGTSALNYDISNKKVISQLKEWEKEMGILIRVIDYNRIEAFIDWHPKKLKKFANEVYAFCPNVIDKGYGSIESMLKDYEENSYFWLWWD